MNPQTRDHNTATIMCLKTTPTPLISVQEEEDICFRRAGRCVFRLMETRHDERVIQQQLAILYSSKTRPTGKGDVDLTGIVTFNYKIFLIVIIAHKVFTVIFTITRLFSNIRKIAFPHFSQLSSKQLRTGKET